MDAFTGFKVEVERTLKSHGWSTRGVFHACKTFGVRAAFDAGETAEAFANRVDREAPLGTACL